MSTPVSHEQNFKHYCTIPSTVYQRSDLVLEFRTENELTHRRLRKCVSVIYISGERNLNTVGIRLFIYMCMALNITANRGCRSVGLYADVKCSSLFALNV